MDERYINQIEVINNIFTIDNGTLKILLFKRDVDPFKGYWMLASNLLMTSETIEQCSLDTIKEFSGFNTAYIEQSHIKSDIDRLPNSRILACSMLSIVDINNTRENKNIESEFFDINSLPKLVYDHNIIIDTTLEHLKTKIKNNELLDIFFKVDFTLPELQKLYEFALDKKLDRRNFRKKLIAEDMIEDTGYKNKTEVGRPAKLYKFKQNNKKTEEL